MNEILSFLVTIFFAALMGVVMGFLGYKLISTYEKNKINSRGHILKSLEKHVDKVFITQGEKIHGKKSKEKKD